MRHQIFGAAMVALTWFAAGCGGGGGVSASGGDGSGSDTQSGPFSVRSLGAVNTMTMAGQNAIVVGMSGSTINQVRYQQPNIGSLTSEEALRSTVITWHSFGRSGNAPVLYDYGRQDYLYPAIDRPTYSNDAFPSISPLYDRLVWAPYDLAGQKLAMHFPDGSGEYVVAGGANATFARYSPNGQKIAYIKSNQLVVANASGSSPVTLTSEAGNLTCLDWRPDGTGILFGTNLGKIKLVPAAGGTAATLYDGSTFVTSVSWANNNRWLGLLVGTPSIKIFGTETGWTGSQSTGADVKVVSFSPDGSKMACNEVYNAAQVMSIRDAFDFTSVNPNRVLESNLFKTPSWSRYLDRKTLVGSGGSYGATAAGFLYSMTDGNFAAFVGFTSPNPASVQVIKGDNSVPSQSVLAVTINAPEGLTTLKYQNRLFGTVVSALSISAEGAIIGFDADDGRIQFVLPYADAQPSRQPDGTYKGNFLGVFDSNGKNLAEHGAKSVRLSKDRADIR